MLRRQKFILLLTLLSIACAPHLTPSSLCPDDLKEPLTVAIPSKGIVLFEAKVNGKATGLFVADNGNISGTMVSPDFAKTLGIDPSQKVVELELEIGGVKLSLKAKVEKGPNDYYSNSLQKKYHCLVGYEFFEKYLITIDYPSSKMTISQYPEDSASTQKSHSKAIALPFEHVEHAALVKTTLYKEKDVSIETAFFVDCGMTGNSIDREHYKKLPTTQKQKGMTSYSLANVAGTKFKNVDFFILDNPSVQEAAKKANRDVAGLLGRPLLERYVVTFDYKGKVIYLESPTK